MVNTRTTPLGVGNIRRHPSRQAGRSPVIVLTSQVNLIQLQRQLKDLRTTSQNSVTQKWHQIFHERNDGVFSHPPIQPSSHPISHTSAPAEDISDGLVNLSFDVISVKPMPVTRQSRAEGTTAVNIPLFLITLPMTPQSHEILRLKALFLIAISVQA